MWQGGGGANSGVGGGGGEGRRSKHCAPGAGDPRYATGMMYFRAQWDIPKPDVILWEFLSGIASVLTEGTNMSVLSDRGNRRIFLPYVTTHACAGAST